LVDEVERFTDLLLYYGFGLRLFCFQGAWMKNLSLVRGLGYHTELCLFCFGGGGACCGLRLFRGFNGSFGGVEDIVD
jgi:hypothetical protein